MNKLRFAGYLDKLSKHDLCFNRRWVEFDGCTLRYFDTKGSNCKGSLKVFEAVMGEAITPSKFNRHDFFSFLGNKPKPRFRFTFTVNNEEGETITFACTSVEDRDLCIYLFNSYSMPDPNFDRISTLVSQNVAYIQETDTTKKPPSLKAC